MELTYGKTFELETLDGGFLARCVYMQHQASTGLGWPGGLEWITGDGTRWVVGIESLEIPEHLFLRCFPELDALSKGLWRTEDPGSFQRLGGWYGRDTDLCLAVFVREAFFNAHVGAFLPFNGKTDLYGERQGGSAPSWRGGPSAHTLVGDSPVGGEAHGNEVAVGSNGKGIDMIIAGFSGTGKSTFAARIENAVDLTSMPFSRILPTDDSGEPEAEKAAPWLLNDPLYPDNYVAAVLRAEGRYDYVIIPTSE